ncbi:MAG: hypothetical protein RI932_1016, partial [Pseudomonadota bacterium]
MTPEAANNLAVTLQTEKGNDIG